MMKAVVNTEYGTPDVLSIQEVPKPQCNADEILVKIKSISINPLDRHILKGVLPARPVTGFLKPKNKILGADFSGIIAQVGTNITAFKPGDAVFGANGTRSNLGAFSEYIAVSDKNVALKPPSISFDEAAAVPIAALTALQGIKNIGKIQEGHKVLVNGSSGGVGTFTVQLAKLMGAEVTAVCSTRNINMVRSIGADFVIDYTREDYTKNGKFYNVIIDNVGNRSIAENRKVLSAQGKLVMIGFTSLKLLFTFMIQSPWYNKTTRQKLEMLDMDINASDLKYLADLMEKGKIVSVIDRCYTFSQMKEAMFYLVQGHARGKIIVQVD